MSENKKNSDIRLIQLANYVSPQIIESKSKDWVLNGAGNSFFDYVIDRYNGSPTNGAIINGYVNLIFGKGLIAKDSNKKPNEWLRVKSIISNKELRKIVLDYQLQGQFAMQIQYNRDGSINNITHFPIETLAPERQDEDGKINAYYYSGDWNKPKGENEPIRIPAYGTTGKGVEIYVGKNYNPNKMYFANPDYIQALQYAELEEEISNFYINHIKNGFSFGYIINMNNGVPETEEQKIEIERKIQQKMTGTNNAGRVFISFNDGKEAEVNIIPLEVNDAHNQWESLNREAEEKIMRAHKVVSPMLFGIKNNTGLGNNADELDTAMSMLMDMNINPKQKFIIDALNTVLNNDGLFLDLDFEAYVENEVAEVESSFTGIQISSALDIISRVNTGELNEVQASSLLRSMLAYPEAEIQNLFGDNKTTLSKDILLKELDNVADSLIELGEDITDEWELLEERTANEITLTEEKLNTIIQLAKVPSSNNARQSKQDTSLFKIRYKYAGNPNPERVFCKKIMNANKFYRVEDLEKASNMVVNEGFGPQGTDKYNIFFYKGGVNCKHFWQRSIFLKKDSKQISVNQARKLILELDPEDRPAARWEQNPSEVAQIAGEKNNYWKLS